MGVTRVAQCRHRRENLKRWNLTLRQCLIQDPNASHIREEFYKSPYVRIIRPSASAPIREDSGNHHGGDHHRTQQTQPEVIARHAQTALEGFQPRRLEQAHRPPRPQPGDHTDDGFHGQGD